MTSKTETIDAFSFVRLASFSIDIVLGDVWQNAQKIISCAEKAHSLNCNVVSFQPLVLTGSTCGSLFLDNFFLENAKKALFYIADKTKDFSPVLFVGLPIKRSGRLYNGVACINDGKVFFINVLPQVFESLPFFNDESFIKIGKKEVLFGSVILLKLVLPSGNSVCIKCVNDKVINFENNVNAGIEIVFSNRATHAGDDELSLYSSVSKKRNNILLISSSSITENDECNVYSNLTAIIENGEVLDSHSVFNNGFSYADVDVELINSNLYSDNCNNIGKIVEIELKGFANINALKRPVSILPFISFFHPSKERIASYISSLFVLQVEAIKVRLKSIGIEKVVLGVSGGLDSTIALLFCMASFKKYSLPLSNVYAFNMPCFGTTERTKLNAISLCKILHCNIEEISIKASLLQHFKDIGQDYECFDVTFENAQARERIQVLMDKANQLGAIVFGSSDLSEIALGFSTYNGDHMAMYNLNSSIPKTILRLCMEYAIENPFLFLEDKKDEEKFKEILYSILKTPISPELLPPNMGEITQKTEEILGSYDLQDFFIYHVCFNHYSPNKILFLAKKAFNHLSLDEISTSLTSFYRRFFKSQFKRNCSPEGINSTGFSLSNWKMPSNINFSFE